MAFVGSDNTFALRTRIVAGIDRMRLLPKRRRLQLLAIGQGVGALAVGLFVVVGMFTGLRTIVDRSYFEAIAPTIPLEIRSGDSLWSLAARYGDPEEPILDRIDALAHVNGLRTNATLVPGQSLLIKIGNPDEAARLQPILAMR